MEAGDRFVSQVQPVLHPRSLAVVLLNSEGHPGQVAFTWGPPHRCGTSHGPSLPHNPSLADIPEHSLRINLQGQEGSLGAVLFRGDFPHGCGYEQAEPLQAITRQLALTLENIQLKERLRRKSIEDQALQNIASLFAANLPPGPLYRCFADEVKQLMRYDRITFYLADETSGDLRRVCQLGLGVCRSEPGPKARFWRRCLGVACFKRDGFDNSGQTSTRSLPLAGPGRQCRSEICVDSPPSATQVKLPLLLQWKAGGQMPVGRPSWAFCPRPRNS